MKPSIAAFLMLTTAVESSSAIQPPLVRIVIEQMRELGLESDLGKCDSLLLSAQEYAGKCQ